MVASTGVLRASVSPPFCRHAANGSGSGSVGRRLVAAATKGIAIIARRVVMTASTAKSETTTPDATTPAAVVDTGKIRLGAGWGLLPPTPAR